MYHYVYLLINTITGHKYIGKRSCNIHPNLDTSYMGSSRYVPKEQCDKIILSLHSSSKLALDEEIRLHNLYEVGINPDFYNKAKQTSTSFDTTGIKTKMKPETKVKIGLANKGVSKTLTNEQREKLKAHLAKFRTPEVRKKASTTLSIQGSNKGIKNSQFTPWYISTPTVTHLFLNIPKNTKAIQDGFKSPKHYVDLQRKLKGSIKHRVYGTITAIGNLPKQYKI